MLNALQQLVGEGNTKFFLADPSDPEAASEDNSVGWANTVPAQLRELCNAYTTDKEGNSGLFHRFVNGIPVIGYKLEVQGQVRHACGPMRLSNMAGCSPNSAFGWLHASPLGTINSYGFPMYLCRMLAGGR